MTARLLDCTLRDGGYYNAWDFSPELIQEYLQAMKAAHVDVVEMGFRFLSNENFKGATAFTTDEYLHSLNVPPDLTIGVMINAADLFTEIGRDAALEHLFPVPAEQSPVELVRIACHFTELEKAFPAAGWLSRRGYRVGVNLMQISERSRAEIAEFTAHANQWPVEVLYVADSMGSMDPPALAQVIHWMREDWPGAVGVHTHDNLGLALQNTLAAHEAGATWLDSTVSGMGRGPGNAQTEELAIELETKRSDSVDLVPLMTLVRRHFEPLKSRYGWGKNPYYYLAGKYGIHPTYIQEMLGDARYDDSDILAVIQHLREAGGTSFSFDKLDGAQRFYQGEPRGTWAPATVMEGREVLLLGTGPGVAAHRPALETFIRRAKPLVLALNTNSAIEQELIDLRIACHPVRLLADAQTHTGMTQALITPASMLPESLLDALGDKEVLDFGLGIEADRFEFHENHCIAPNALVLAYALAVAKSGHADRILMAGFDGYPAGDPRNEDIDNLLQFFMAADAENSILSITPSIHKMPQTSIYGLLRH